MESQVSCGGPGAAADTLAKVTAQLEAVTARCSAAEAAVSDLTAQVQQLLSSSGAGQRSTAASPAGQGDGDGSHTFEAVWAELAVLTDRIKVQQQQHSALSMAHTTVANDVRRMTASFKAEVEVRHRRVVHGEGAPEV